MKIKGLLIDPDNETIEYVDCEDNLNGIKSVLGCKYITVVGIGLDHHFYCDDEGLINGEHTKGFKSNLYGGMIAGKAIIFSDDGEGGEDYCMVHPDSVHVEWCSL